MTTYRGLTCHYEYPPIPIREYDWIASDPNGDGEILANGSTLEELKADIDLLVQEKEGDYA